MRQDRATLRSAATGRATPTSDLDVFVLLPDGAEDISYVETTHGHAGDMLVNRQWLGTGKWLVRSLQDRKRLRPRAVGH